MIELASSMRRWKKLGTVEDVPYDNDIRGSATCLTGIRSFKRRGLDANIAAAAMTSHHH